MVRQAYSIEDLRDAAQKSLPRAIFDFFDGGAEDEITLRANRTAFEKIALVPRVLRDVSMIDTASLLFEKTSAMPVAIAPTGALGFGKPGADLALAKAAAHFGIPYTLSSSATASIESIAKHASGRLWFQAYILRNKPFLQSMIERARAADFEALMITVDLPVGGKRERDHRNDFSIPFKFSAKNIFDFAQHPRWALNILRNGMPVMENLVGLDASNTTNASAIASSVGKNYDPSFNWDELKKIRDLWPRKLIVKGILNCEDAKQVVAMGCDALSVSNHGGRQLDGCIASFDALGSVVAAVGGKVPVFVDGGVRRGSDIVKAVATGASGVLVGRATLYGAVAHGDAGAHRALTILKDELERTMRLCGAAKLADISRLNLLSQ